MYIKRVKLKVHRLRISPDIKKQPYTQSHFGICFTDNSESGEKSLPGRRYRINTVLPGRHHARKAQSSHPHKTQYRPGSSEIPGSCPVNPEIQDHQMCSHQSE